MSILLITLYILSSTVDSFLNRYELHIINALSNNDIPPWYHCASGDKDFRYHILKVDEDFHFEFSVNHILSTLYFCHFWWGKNQNVFDVFNHKLFHICSSSPNEKSILVIGKYKKMVFLLVLNLINYHICIIGMSNILLVPKLLIKFAF